MTNEEATVEDRLELANVYLRSLARAHEMVELYEGICKAMTARKEAVDRQSLRKLDFFVMERETWRGAISECLFGTKKSTPEQMAKIREMYRKIQGYGYGEKVFEEEGEVQNKAVSKQQNTVPTAPPLCVVRLSSKYSPSETDMEGIRKDLKAEWEKIWNGRPPCPIFVLPPDMDCYFG